METILLTGAAGFIGFHTAQALLKQGFTVIGVDNLNKYYDPKLKSARLKILKKHKNFIFYKTDIANYKQLERIIRKHSIQQICHLAAQAGVRYSVINPFAYLRSNIDGTLNVFELAKEYKISEVVYASSSSVYGENKQPKFSETDNVDYPISLYAATKKSDELIAHVYKHIYGIKSIGLRFFTVYGPWGRPDMALFSFTDSIIKGKPIQVFNKGNMYRDFTYIDDIVSGIISALKNVDRLKYEIINLGNNDPVKLSNFIDVLEKALGLKAKKQLMPLQKGDVLKTSANITKAKRLLNYQPKTSLEEGIGEFIQWYKEYFKI